MSVSLTAEALASALSMAGMSGKLEEVVRLTGGANKESWRIKLLQGAEEKLYVVRRNSGGQGQLNKIAKFGQPSLRAEAELILGLAGSGLKIPTVVAQLYNESPIGEFFVMTCEPGESIPKRILKDDKYSAARSTLAAECGRQLAVLHGLNLELKNFAQLQVDLNIAQRIEQMHESSIRLGNTSPVHALAYHWLRDNIPESSHRCLIHGDFRLGNILVEETGLSSVLDWELAKISHPEEDLGYITANIWRFNRPEKPVGGFGDYDDLLDAYERQAGWRPQLNAIKFWQFFTAVSWGNICLAMREMFVSGQDKSLERLAVGRRFSESEVDILLLLEELA